MCGYPGGKVGNWEAAVHQGLTISRPDLALRPERHQGAGKRAKALAEQAAAASSVLDAEEPRPLEREQRFWNQKHLLAKPQPGHRNGDAASSLQKAHLEEQASGRPEGPEPFPVDGH